jgi:predicted CXXCH cytochrome family protein
VEPCRRPSVCQYFVGSGATARSYLLVDDGYLYEAPVAYYSRSKHWGLAPAYDTYAYPYLTRPVMPACLVCHASRLQTVVGTQNRFAEPPFVEGGVACERCHGPREAHIAKMKAGKLESGAGIVNPAKLPPENRDSICSLCHLSGAVRVMAARRDWRSFHPGERLSDSISVFVKTGGSPGMTVTGHVETLAQSACKRMAGDRLWCGVCHDPHSMPKQAGRTSWFRSKCLGCHTTDACKGSKVARLGKQDDCIACICRRIRPWTRSTWSTPTIRFLDGRRQEQPSPSRMPNWRRSTAADRPSAISPWPTRSRPSGNAVRRTGRGPWRCFRKWSANFRTTPKSCSIWRSYTEMAANRTWRSRSTKRAIRLDPAQVTASVGLGGIMMERGAYAEVIELWEDALTKNAGLELVRTNLAMVIGKLGTFGPRRRIL